MNAMTLVFIALAAAFLAWGIVIFNRLIRDRNLARAGYSDIDVQLQRRHDLVPQLVTAVRAYASYEREVLEQVTAARSRAAGVKKLKERDAAESGLAAGISRLLALAEDYPDLKADGNFRQLMTELVDVEDHLQHARRFYNGAVRAYNTRVQQFPDLIVAQLLRFKEAEYFSAGIEARVAPVVEDVA